MATKGTENGKPESGSNMGSCSNHHRGKIRYTQVAGWSNYHPGHHQYGYAALSYCAQGNEGPMLKRSDSIPVFLACGDTDMRKSINGLSAIIQNSFELDPFDKALFVFCNRQRNRLKILTWEDNGFWLHFKRLERGHFKWPTAGESRTMALSVDELWNLIQGPGIEQKLRRTEVRKSR